MLRFNLLAMVRRARPALARMNRRIKLREITPTAVHTGDLERIYGRIIRYWWESARDRVMPTYTAALDRANVPGVVMDDETGAAGMLRQLMDELRQEADRLVLHLTADLGDWTVLIERWHRKRWNASMTPTGVSLDTMLSSSDVGDTVEAALQQNVSLVRNLSDSLLRRIEQVIFEGFTHRTPAQEVARQLSEAVGIERRRAVRIASDQLLKLSSQLDTERMKQAGIDEWEWVHSGKLHFRPVHKARNGNIYTWENAPEDLPGMLPYCGCKKRAVLDL